MTSRDTRATSTTSSPILTSAPDSVPLVVQKYGGMSLATPENIRAAARRVAILRASGTNVIAVVSAMGAATDRLIELAYSVSPKPNRRELDMLLSTGERVSMALFSMALTDALLELAPMAKAISFTGSQAGILTDENHSNARIIDVKSIRVQQELTRGNVVILAGFQGVSPITKEITTLGRGGTDVTAVALAASFKATRCEILKEVPGVLSADPKIVPSARPLKNLTHLQLLDMTFWGAKVLHYRSVELASTHSVPLTVGLAHTGETNSSVTQVFTKTTTNEKRENMVNETTPNFENSSILAVTSHADVRTCVISANSIAKGIAVLRQTLSRQNLPSPQILDVSLEKDAVLILLTAPTEVLEAQTTALKTNASLKMDGTKRSTVTVTCQGAYASNMIDTLVQKLEQKNISPQKVLAGALSVTFLVNEGQRNETVQTLHG